MKSYKVLFTIGCVVIALIVGMIIGIMLPEKTVDFNGSVIEITEQEDGTYMLKAESIAGGEFSSSQQFSRLLLLSIMKENSPPAIDSAFNK